MNCFNCIDNDFIRVLIISIFIDFEFSVIVGIANVSVHFRYFCVEIYFQILIFSTISLREKKKEINSLWLMLHLHDIGISHATINLNKERSNEMLDRKGHSANVKFWNRSVISFIFTRQTVFFLYLNLKCSLICCPSAISCNSLSSRDRNCRHFRSTCAHVHPKQTKRTEQKSKKQE